VVKVYKDLFGQEEMVQSFVPIWGYEIDNSQYIAVLLLSDGVHSFQKKVIGTGKTYEMVEMRDVIGQMVKFKSWNGDFVKRRMKRFIKQMVELGWENTDDVSMAGLYLR
jgi:hypothetical protein